jgi:hypothetical protein
LAKLATPSLLANVYLIEGVLYPLVCAGDAKPPSLYLSERTGQETLHHQLKKQTQLNQQMNKQTNVQQSNKPYKTNVQQTFTRSSKQANKQKNNTNKYTMFLFAFPVQSRIACVIFFSGLSFPYCCSAVEKKTPTRPSAKNEGIVNET